MTGAAPNYSQGPPAICCGSSSSTTPRNDLQPKRPSRTSGSKKIQSQRGSMSWPCDPMLPVFDSFFFLHSAFQTLPEKDIPPPRSITQESGPSMIPVAQNTSLQNATAHGHLGAGGFGARESKPGSSAYSGLSGGGYQATGSRKKARMG